MAEEEFKPRQTPSEYERKNSRPKNAIETALKVAGILILGALGVCVLLYAVAFALVSSVSYQGATSHDTRHNPTPSIAVFVAAAQDPKLFLAQRGDIVGKSPCSKYRDQCFGNSLSMSSERLSDLENCASLIQYGKSLGATTYFNQEQPVRQPLAGADALDFCIKTLNETKNIHGVESSSGAFEVEGEYIPTHVRFKAYVCRNVVDPAAKHLRYTYEVSVRTLEFN